MIKVLLVDDSPIVLAVMEKILATDPEIQVVGKAGNGLEGLAMIPQLCPQVICSDLHMPKMDGLQFTREVMVRHPLPILVVSISVQQGVNDHNIFELLEAGAIDVFPKPRGGLLGNSGEALCRELIRKIRILSGVVAISRRRVIKSDLSVAHVATRTDIPKNKKRSVRLVAIGASTGGPQALLTLFSGLPNHFPVPIVCIQHISTGFLNDMVSWLNSHTSLRVQVAVQGERPLPGNIYFPPEERHLIVNDQGVFATPQEVPSFSGLENGFDIYCPSVNVTFHSVARYYGTEAVGILLTGMGSDGALGLKNIREAGGWTIAQDEASCVVFGMPKQAIDLGAAQLVLPVAEMAQTLIEGITTR
ncbi:MAG: chemotaxis-specific protein-glutamate methyltransferase CheB [Magnetococcus sp. DMHC-6]